MNNCYDIILTSECWFVFLDLYHELVNVDEVGGCCDLREGSHAENSAEPVIVLDQRGQALLQQRRPQLEVREGRENLAVDGVKGLFPVSVELCDDPRDSPLLRSETVEVSSL